MSSAAFKIFRNITTNWLGLFLNIAVSFFLAPFVVNHLGADMYGIWAVAMQFTGYIYLMDFGVRDAIIRYTAKYMAMGKGLALRRILSVALIIYIPLFLIALFVSLGIAYAFPYWAHISEDQRWASQLTVFLIGASISSGFLFNIFTGLLQGVQRFDITNGISALVTLCRAATIVHILGQGGGLVEMAWIQFGFTCVSGLLFFSAAIIVMAKEEMVIKPIAVTRKKLRVLVRLVSGYSIYVFINNVGQKLAIATDALVISIFLPIASVTYYAIAGNLISYLWTLVAATAQVFNPVASQLAAKNDKEGLQALLLRSTRLNLTIGLPVIGAFVALGDVFISLWMGPDFVEPASEILVVLAFAQILSCPHHPIASILYGIGKHRWLAFLRLAEGIVNLLLSIILVQSIGVIGVAFGTAIPHTLLFGIILPIYGCRLLGISFVTYIKRSLLGPLVNAIPFVILLWTLHDNLASTSLATFFLAMAGASLIYVASGYVFCLERAERKTFRDYLKKLLPLRA